MLSAESLAKNPRDVPFALIYLADAEKRAVRLAASVGIERGLAASPERASLDGPSPWPFAEALRSHAPVAGRQSGTARPAPGRRLAAPSAAGGRGAHRRFRPDGPGGSAGGRAEHRRKGPPFGSCCRRAPPTCPARGSAPAATWSPPRPGPPPYVEEALRWLPGREGAAQALLATDGLGDGQVPDAQAHAGARILLADDNADMREYVRRLLSERWRVKVVREEQRRWRRRSGSGPTWC